MVQQHSIKQLMSIEQAGKRCKEGSSPVQDLAFKGNDMHGLPQRLQYPVAVPVGQPGALRARGGGGGLVKQGQSAAPRRCSLLQRLQRGEGAARSGECTGDAGGSQRRRRSAARAAEMRAPTTARSAAAARLRGAAAAAKTGPRGPWVAF